MKGILSYFCKSIGQLCIYRRELKPRLRNFIAWVHWTAHTTLPCKWDVLLFVSPDLCADFISGCGAGAGELCSGQGQERRCDAQFHFSRTLPPPPSPQPPAPSPAPSCRAAARYLHWLSAQCRYGLHCSVLHHASLQFYLAAVNNRTVAWLQR